MKPTIAITIGDFNGIGPEIVLKSIASQKIKKAIRPVLIGSFTIFSHYAKKFRIKLPLREVGSLSSSISASDIPVITTHAATIKNLMVGKIAPDAGVCAGSAIEKAITLCLSGEVQGMVTAPVSKEALHYAGYNFPGQTEMLAMLTRSDHVTMMLMTRRMKVALATVHIPVKSIVENLSIERIVDKLDTVNTSMKNDLDIKRPRIAVLGLNPHAGENGAIGMEEKEIIIPAIQRAKEKKIDAAGPFPADGFFATYDPKKYDAIFAMYHDQGLIPLKMSGFDEGVNFSAGLKIIRTSPDHGTAFDIAGKGIAHPGSMNEAVLLAASIAQRRKN